MLLLLLLHVVTSSENGNQIGKRNMVQREKSGREKQQFYEWKKNDGVYKQARKPKRKISARAFMK